MKRQIRKASPLNGYVHILQGGRKRNNHSKNSIIESLNNLNPFTVFMLEFLTVRLIGDSLQIVMNILFSNGISFSCNQPTQRLVVLYYSSLFTENDCVHRLVTIIV